MARLTRSAVFFSGGIMVFAGLSACAPSAEFQAPPQAGAWHSNSYPSFSTKPQAAGPQFTQTDQDRLMKQLHSEGKSLDASAFAETKKRAAEQTPADAQEQANKEIQDTLRQIKNDN